MVESTSHALFECTWAQLFWGQMKQLTGLKIPSMHPESWPIDIVQGGLISAAEACLIMCGCWAVWSERNARRHGDAGRSVGASVRWSIDTTMDLANAGKDVRKKTQKMKVQWKPPEIGVIKVNVDASFFEQNGNGGTGVVVRDHGGQLLCAQALWYEFVAGPHVMEAYAIRDGLRLALQMGLRSIVLESDASVVVGLLNSGNFDRSGIAPILHEVMDVGENLEQLQLCHVGRSSNEAAHLCARQSSDTRKRCLWINYTPAFLAKCLLNDCKLPY